MPSKKNTPFFLKKETDLIRQDSDTSSSAKSSNSTVESEDRIGNRSPTLTDITSPSTPSMSRSSSQNFGISKELSSPNTEILKSSASSMISSYSLSSPIQEKNSTGRWKFGALAATATNAFRNKNIKKRFAIDEISRGYIAEIETLPIENKVYHQEQLLNSCLNQYIKARNLKDMDSPLLARTREELLHTLKTGTVDEITFTLNQFLDTQYELQSLRTKSKLSTITEKDETEEEYQLPIENDAAETKVDNLKEFKFNITNSIRIIGNKYRSQRNKGKPLSTLKESGFEVMRPAFSQSSQTEVVKVDAANGKIGERKIINKPLQDSQSKVTSERQEDTPPLFRLMIANPTAPEDEDANQNIRNNAFKNVVNTSSSSEADDILPASQKAELIEHYKKLAAETTSSALLRTQPSANEEWKEIKYESSQNTQNDTLSIEQQDDTQVFSRPLLIANPTTIEDEEANENIKKAYGDSSPRNLSKNSVGLIEQQSKIRAVEPAIPKSPTQEALDDSKDLLKINLLKNEGLTAAPLTEEEQEISAQYQNNRNDNTLIKQQEATRAISISSTQTLNGDFYIDLNGVSWENHFDDLNLNTELLSAEMIKYLQKVESSDSLKEYQIVFEDLSKKIKQRLEKLNPQHSDNKNLLQIKLSFERIEFFINEVLKVRQRVLEDAKHSKRSQTVSKIKKTLLGDKKTYLVTRDSLDFLSATQPMERTVAEALKSIDMGTVKEKGIRTADEIIQAHHNHPITKGVPLDICYELLDQVNRNGKDQFIIEKIGTTYNKTFSGKCFLKKADEQQATAAFLNIEGRHAVPMIGYMDKAQLEKNPNMTAGSRYNVTLKSKGEVSVTPSEMSNRLQKQRR